MNKDVLIIGGGAAGFFAAINLATLRPDLTIAILERGKEVLTKVRISGGGRCNVTHAEFVPKELTLNYPRGEKELLGPFHSFMTGDTIGWFADRGVALKIEEDGRMFPTTDSSQTIIDCFLSETKRLGINVLTNHAVQNFERASENDNWILQTSKGTYQASHLVIATGSNPKIWKLLEHYNHTITPAVPSLFTFNIKDKRIEGLMGLSTEAAVRVVGMPLASEGPLLITHWGMSGPGILKLSAWGARLLEETKYHFEIRVNWLLHTTTEEAMSQLLSLKHDFAKQSPHTYAQLDLPKRLWQSLLIAADIPEGSKWADLKKHQLSRLTEELTNGSFRVSGKSTFKEEFVTAGGIALKEVNFKRFESRLHPDLYFAGEVLNIDAITGGFNFQNAWTGGYLVAQAIANT
ncbi:MAG: putative Rossmann fold flavoprotein [Flavobacteriales bacterium]|jgi:predicted Rossmann fold flavoprotein